MRHGNGPTAPAGRRIYLKGIGGQAAGAFSLPVWRSPPRNVRKTPTFAQLASQNTLKVFTRDGSLWNSFHTGFDAWGNYGVSDDDTPPAPQWGHACWMPIGHYILGSVQKFDEPIVSEGYGQIPVLDMDSESLAQLVKGGYARANGLTAVIGGIEAPLAQLSEYGREAIFIHGGGSNSPDPLADRQQLCRTFGCTRMLNADWRELAAWLKPLYDGNVIVYTALETPANLGR